MDALMQAVTWPLDQLGEAVHALGSAAGLSPRAMTPPFPSGAVEVWLEQTASHFGLEAERLNSSYAEVRDMLTGVAPALVRVLDRSAPGEPVARFVALLGTKRKKIIILKPDRTTELLTPEQIVDWLCADLEARGRPQIERMLTVAKIDLSQRRDLMRSILREWYGDTRLNDVWRLRLPPGASAAAQISEARLPKRLFTVIACQAAAALVISLGWWIIGQGSFDNQLGRGWMLGWALLLLSAIPLGLLGAWSAGLFAIDAGVWLKRRLLAGALALETDEVRDQGVGGFLGCVIESEAVESLALGAGLAGITSSISLLIALVLLAQGAGGAGHAVLLAAWVVISAFIIARYHHKRRDWTDTRLRLTNDLVERMNGHRTRLAQEPRERWHDDEDRALLEYHGDSKTLDRVHVLVTALLSRGWFVIGVLGLVPAFVTGTSPPTDIAISLAGVLLAGAAMQGLVISLSSLASALISWRRVAPLFHAAARERPAPAPLAVAASAPAAGDTIVEAQGLVFRHSDRAQPVLRGLNLTIGAGDRLLLAGPSGAGKSTLSALLSGLRSPESGLLLMGGFDRRSHGDHAWRRRVVTTPQFHENHVLQSTLGFNLLMGRAWPASPEDLKEARAICEELGLGELLARMPSGLDQLVGETGWQLSHGEKSRIYIARALLQRADVFMFDESFGALDPETLAKALNCVLSRARTVLVIAHP